MQEDASAAYSDPPVHFGAVYFRKSNPPREDWEKDYPTAREDGLTLFRHWVPWGAVEVKPGEFDWADYDRQLDLAAEYGIATVLAEMTLNFPEWLWARFPHARLEDRHGKKRESGMHVSCVTGGAHSMCLDNPEVSGAAAKFLNELGSRYRNHRAFFAYDVWNECSYYGPENMCFCPATHARFREWLKGKYGDLDSLGKAWLRYSFSSWDEVMMPRYVAPYPDFFDLVDFQLENACGWMKWRIDLLKKADLRHPVAAHGNARSHLDIAPACGDDWRAGELADIFGYTCWHNNRCHPLMAADMTRSAAGGRAFWRAEAVGGNEWAGRRADHKPHLEKEMMADPANIRLDCLVSLAAGARVYQTPRWRPLLDGPLFGAYGWYGMDGSRTERSEMVASLAKWANHPARADLWQARPVMGEIAVLLLEEAQAWCYAHYGDTSYFADSLKGCYQAFLDLNIQCDIIKIHQIDDYAAVYVPFPVALKSETADRLRAWVAKGGSLVSEACFGYFTERGHACERQPTRGFEQVFGCREKDVSFAPDMWNGLKIRLKGSRLAGGLFRQAYIPTAGTARGWFSAKETAIVDNSYGKGRARLVGTMPGYAYQKNPGKESRMWFASLLAFAGKRQLVKVDKAGVAARLWEGDGNTFLWALNLSPAQARAKVEISPSYPLEGRMNILRGPAGVKQRGRRISMTVPGRDAVVLEFRK